MTNNRSFTLTIIRRAALMRQQLFRGEAGKDKLTGCLLRSKISSYASWRPA
ncbi:predicted protein [Sclerotinia sclerotiorum 1980 UF-70]|uniref:Uncharacterized protein n=1 Tax=Sclerotinia sclerotiorum (strain ATCC 18683 / 1980 / Ss-1) TaxID=665079 RepID=A7F6B2_SCLS1|nr:predicted protein [Sclerotinia sclerotiorum 1980 UF-70]EDN98283.1 predicted protein [Sclerotinia sclerotiorum 1980 UF-70]